MELPQQDRAVATACLIKQSFWRRTRSYTHAKAPQTSATRLEASLDDAAFDLQREEHLVSNNRSKTVLYLAYGSNLSIETFRGKRGIKPISQINVQVPCLRLTFDLPGIPYAEPCFANSGSRDPENDPPTESRTVLNEKTPLLQATSEKEEYRKDAWHKGLIGVVYEVTPEDYAHIIATEGGGAAYHDILVYCHPFASADPHAPVPRNPTLPPFKAHTLFAPATPPGEPPKHRGRFQRPDTSYAQPSARYLKLITDGAAELDLPHEYREYISSIRPYTMTSAKQRVGQFVFLSLWAPLIMATLAMAAIFQDEDGKSPEWLVTVSGAIFKGAWDSYDNFFKKLFGDGERSITDGGQEVTQEEASGDPASRRMPGLLSCGRSATDLEKAVAVR